MFIEITLQDCFSFRLFGVVNQLLQDGTIAPTIITDWVIVFLIIINPNDRAQDVIGTTVITEENKYESTLTDAQRDSIFTTYPNKKGLTFHVKATYPNGDGIELGTGDINLKRS